MDKLKEIDENYKVLNLFHLDEQKKIFLGNKEKRRCRFCGKDSRETTFKKTAHTIPEFVENYRLFSLYECDVCNENFSKNLENHMSSYMNLHHSLSQVKGKRGIPSFKVGRNKSRLDWDKEGLSIQEYEEDNFKIVENDETNKTIKIQGKRATYIPIAVYKCLTKMALSIMDEEEIVYFKNTIKWINESDHSKSDYQIGNLKAIFTFITSKKSSHTVCFLLKRRENNNNKVPYMIFFISYSNFNFQIHIPICELDRHLFNKNVTIYKVPNVFEIDNEEFDGQSTTVLDLSSTEKVKDDIVEIFLSYDSSTISHS